MVNEKTKRTEKLTENRNGCQQFCDRELVKDLGFQNTKQKPKYVIK